MKGRVAKHGKEFLSSNGPAMELLGSQVALAHRKMLVLGKLTSLKEARRKSCLSSDETDLLQQQLRVMGYCWDALRVSTWHQNLETKAATGVEHVIPVGTGGAMPVLA